MVRPYGEVAYVRELGDSGTVLVNEGHTIRGATYGESNVGLGAGIEAVQTNGFALTLDYSGTINSLRNIHAVSATARFGF